MNITIITVCYNSVSTIEQTIQSVIAQGYENIEYIIIDGNSTDGTVDLLKKYNDCISFWISEDDDGIYDAMNKGIRCATGEYTMFIGSDDRLAFGVIKRCVQYLNDGIDILYGDVYNVWQDGRQIRRVGQIVNMEDIIYRGICHQAVLAKTSLLKKYGFDLRYKVSADYDWLLKVFYDGAKFAYVPIVFAYYNMTGYSAMNEEIYVQEAKQIRLKYLMNLDQKTKDKYYPLIEKAYDDYLRRLYFKKICKNKENQKKVKTILADLFDEEENVLMFGRGGNAGYCLDILKVMRVNVLKIIDNDKKAQGTLYKNIEVIGLNEVWDKKIKVVISVIKHEKEIYKQLVRNGFHDIILFSEISDRICNIID